MPYLLFSYREVPQASTAFSTFELAYGPHVRGPLDVLQEAWAGDHTENVNVLSFILHIREKLADVSELVQQNLGDVPDDQVLLPLPTSSKILEAAWQESFSICRKVDPVDYKIEMPGRRKKRRKVHVNLLKR